MIDPRAIRSVAKRLVGWESPTARGPAALLRAFFLRDMDAGVRYGPLVGQVRAAARVLEVGSGPAGIAPFARRRVIGADLSFDGPRDLRLHPVTARGSALPFPGKAFDVVVCVDVLEHVPEGERAAVMAELARVCAERLLIAVPTGPDAAAADRAADELHRRTGHGGHRWLAEHIECGLPEADDIRRLVVTAGGRVVSERRYTPIWLWWLARREEMLFRPHLVLLRRLVLPLVLPLLWKLPARRAYRTLFEIDVAAPGVTSRPA